MKNIATALLQAQKEMSGVKKDANNPFFKSKYATLEAVIEASKDALNKNGIIALQPHGKDEFGFFVKTVLIHSESGESLESRTDVICAKQNDPQALGSAITYARRYGLQSFLLLPAEDDDAESAMNRQQPNKPRQPQRPSGNKYF